MFGVIGDLVCRDRSDLEIAEGSRSQLLGEIAGEIASDFRDRQGDLLQTSSRLPWLRDRDEIAERRRDRKIAGEIADRPENRDRCDLYVLSSKVGRAQSS